MTSFSDSVLAVKLFCLSKIALDAAWAFSSAAFDGPERGAFGFSIGSGCLGVVGAETVPDGTTITRSGSFFCFCGEVSVGATVASSFVPASSPSV